jgi:hypothetical protein
MHCSTASVQAFSARSPEYSPNSLSFRPDGGMMTVRDANTEENFNGGNTGGN